MSLGGQGQPDSRIRMPTKRPGGGSEPLSSLFSERVLSSIPFRPFSLTRSPPSSFSPVTFLDAPGASRGLSNGQPAAVLEESSGEGRRSGRPGGSCPRAARGARPVPPVSAMGSAHDKRSTRRADGELPAGRKHIVEASRSLLFPCFADPTALHTARPTRSQPPFAGTAPQATRKGALTPKSQVVLRTSSY